MSAVTTKRTPASASPIFTGRRRRNLWRRLLSALRHHREIPAWLIAITILAVAAQVVFGCSIHNWVWH